MRGTNSHLGLGIGSNDSMPALRLQIRALIAANPDVRRGVCATVQNADRLSQPDERRQPTMRSARLSKDRRMRRTVTDTLPTIIGG